VTIFGFASLSERSISVNRRGSLSRSSTMRSANLRQTNSIATTRADRRDGLSCRSQDNKERSGAHPSASRESPGSSISSSASSAEITSDHLSEPKISHKNPPSVPLHSRPEIYDGVQHLMTA
jgi:hypothetical protein